MATYLDKIPAHHRHAASSDSRHLSDLRSRALDQPSTRGFRDALRSTSGLAVVAEVKRRSPSKGDLRADLDPASLAAEYQRGGASCPSVLTDTPHFGGSVADLQTVRAACALPVLRKDFTVCAADVYDTRVMGADCILLIATALSATELADLHGLAVEIGLDALIEVHDEEELGAAVAVGGSLIGVNQRDLVTFQVDHDRACRMAGAMPAGVVSVAESGVRGPADAASLMAAGYRAVLVGESLVTSPDPGAALAALRSV